MLLVVLVAVATLVLVAQVGEIFEEAELPTIDTRFRVRGSDGPPPDILVVGIDDVTLQEIGESWPFSLDTYARAINALTASGGGELFRVFCDDDLCADCDSGGVAG